MNFLFGTAVIDGDMDFLLAGRIDDPYHRAERQAFVGGSQFFRSVTLSGSCASALIVARIVRRKALD